MENLRHNPYVGSFHSVDRNEFSQTISPQIIFSNSPFVPMFRHSPGPNNSPTQIKISPSIPQNLHLPTPSEPKSQPKLSIKQIMKDLFQNFPTSYFSPETGDDRPICSICLEIYQDGDEIRTLSCDHCFHRSCIDLWFLGCLNNEEIEACSCPECRRSVSDEDIPSHSFFQVGKVISEPEPSPSLQFQQDFFSEK